MANLLNCMLELLLSLQKAQLSPSVLLQFYLAYPRAARRDASIILDLLFLLALPRQQ